MEPSDLPVGTWVRLKTGHQGTFIAGITKDIYVHLNAIPYVTGRIYGPPPHNTGDFVSFKPDGWPLPDEAWPPGFSVTTNNLEIISPETHEPEPCVLTDRQCRPIPRGQIEQMIKIYLEEQNDS